MGLLVYDGDCAFCTSFVTLARRWVNPGAETLPWQRADLTSLGLTEQQCQDALQYRDRFGRWTSAGRAIAALLRDGRQPWRSFGRVASLPGFASCVDRAYAWAARNRYRLPGGTPACQAPFTSAE